MIRAFIFFTLTFFILQFETNAQIHSIKFFSDYSFALNKVSAVENADAVGGGVKVKFVLSENFYFGFTGGYKLYSISQPDDINTWGWVFWTDRYSNKINSDLIADPNLSVVITSVQKMDLIPFTLFAEHEIPLTEKFSVSTSAGVGIYFYTKRLYAVETWSKKFPAENYTFTYSYRNFAPRKKGSPFFANAGVDLNYSIDESFLIAGSLNYNHALLSSKPSDENFPFKNEINFNFGITILY